MLAEARCGLQAGIEVVMHAKTRYIRKGKVNRISTHVGTSHVWLRLKGASPLNPSLPINLLGPDKMLKMSRVEVFVSW